MKNFVFQIEFLNGRILGKGSLDAQNCHNEQGLYYFGKSERKPGVLRGTSLGVVDGN